MQAPAVSPSSFAVRQTTADDVDLHTACLDDWNLHYEQLDCGAFQGRFTDARWPGVQLFAEETTRRVHQRGLLPARSIAVGCMLAGEGDVFVGGQRQPADVLMAVHAAEVDACTPAGCLLAGVVFDAGLLQEVAAPVGQIEHLLGEGRMLPLQMPPQRLAALRQLLRAAVSAAQQGVLEAAAQRHLRDDLLLRSIEVLAQAEVADDPAPALRKKVVERARDVLIAQAFHPPTLLELSRNVGVSPRKLSYCFEQALGVSPARYLRMLRLNAVRRELRSADPRATGVYDVATRWGFWHFGHFSMEYKRMFGELPSATLQAAA